MCAMIAPLRQTDAPSAGRGPRWRRARRVVADALLRGERPAAVPTVAPVPAWQAWCLTAWVVGTVAVYLWIMTRGG